MEIAKYWKTTVDTLQDGLMVLDPAGNILADISEIVRQKQEIDYLRKSCRLEEGHHGLLGESQPMQDLFELIENVAQTDAPVLVHGQSGTGKELVARAIHEESPRSAKPFIKVNTYGDDSPLTG